MGEGNDAGIETDGEYAWIWNGGSNHYQLVSSFYDNSAVSFKMGVAYPGFDDYYQEGGWGNGLGWEIDPNNGATLKSLLDLALQKTSRTFKLLLGMISEKPQVLSPP